jgi:hypothetical protein
VGLTWRAVILGSEQWRDPPGDCTPAWRLVERAEQDLGIDFQDANNATERPLTGAAATLVA